MKESRGVGSTIAKDYEHDMHSILYSYPFAKWEYLGAKFLSGLCMSIAVVVFAFDFVGERLAYMGNMYEFLV